MALAAGSRLGPYEVISRFLLNQYVEQDSAPITLILNLGAATR